MWLILKILFLIQTDSNHTILLPQGMMIYLFKRPQKTRRITLFKLIPNLICFHLQNERCKNGLNKNRGTFQRHRNTSLLRSYC